MKDLASKLITTCDYVSEKELVMYILARLGSEFKPISTILKVRPDKYSLEEVRTIYFLLNQN